jgi:hypothetical protein
MPTMSLLSSAAAARTVRESWVWRDASGDDVVGGGAPSPAAAPGRRDLRFGHAHP